MRKFKLENCEIVLEERESKLGLKYYVCCLVYGDIKYRLGNDSLYFILRKILKGGVDND